jgi:hypothetical protein
LAAPSEKSDATQGPPERAEQRQERQLAERIASLCGQQMGPWIQWLTHASQLPVPSTDPVDAISPEATSSLAIIEIPEDTLHAIEVTDGPVRTTDESMQETIEENGTESLTESEDRAVPELPDLEIAEPAEPLAMLPAETSPSETSPLPSPAREITARNIRKPRALMEEETDAAGPPRAMSDSMKAKAEETPARRSLKSADEDMRDYLAQEEPAPDSVRNSINDQMQGVDADRAAKPETQNPSENRKNSGRSKTAVPAAMQQRLARTQAVLEHYVRNPETTTARSPWAVMHALLPFGADYELIGANGRVNAIGWMCHNGLCRTQRIFTPRGNSFVPNVGGGVQGHQGQFLAILAQCQVPLDYPIQIGTRRFTVEDLVRYEMATCKERSELTFKLIGLSYYVDADKQWRSNDGKVWNLEKLVQEELAQPVIGSACGGTHRLMGLSFSLRQRELQGLPINGQFARAAKFINEYVQYTWQLQNPDGSFSTVWYQGRGNEPNDERKVQTSGHMLEWLMFTVSDDELTSPRVEKAIDFLLSRIYDRRDHPWPIGPRGHATRALALYNTRIEALLEQRSGAIHDSVAQQPIPSPNPAKTTVNSPPSTSTRPTQTAPGNRPVGQPASRSTGRPSRRVRG